MDDKKREKKKRKKREKEKRRMINISFTVEIFKILFLVTDYERL